MMGGPFSTNLRRMRSNQSSGGAGADHADEMIARHHDRCSSRRSAIPWRGLIVIVALVLAFAMAIAAARAETGLASYYWTGTKTANGERFNPLGMTAAHRTLPFGTMLRVTYQGRSVTVRINDRGPFIKGRTIDLSLGAARAVGLTARGVAPVTIERLN